MTSRLDKIASPVVTVTAANPGALDSSFDGLGGTPR
jgi:hypothetical protein